ncbi:MAG TPA: peptide ABC transporter substrate-binding protein [Candidatus Limnocylindria bacterium]|nr:peptide ABC transporter substrate-binding protein [Candidatus Limnocylindria bacterium]
MRARDKFIVVALIALLVVVSGAAVAIDRAETKTVVATYGGTYVEGVTSAPQYLNPVLAATAVDDDVVRLVFSGLSRYRSDGSIEGDLARSFSTSDDGRVWTFEIRDDATWHDGKPVIADDVVYTVALLQDKAYVGPYSDAFRGVKVERVEDRVVRFTLPDAYGPFAASTTVPLLPSHLLARVDYASLPRVAFNQRPVGTGPFRVIEADARQTVLARSDSFYRTRPDRTRPYLDRLVLRSYPDASEALTALGRGEIDGVGGLATGDAERARGLKNVNLYSFGTNDFTALFLNVRPEKAMFRDRAVRQAIAKAIDRGRVLQVAADGRGAVADEFVPQSSWAYIKDVTRFTRSYEEATALLDEADWKDHDGDGVRDRGGVKLSFAITTSSEQARVAAALQIADDLAVIGMRVELKAMPFSELIERAVRDRTYDALLIGIGVSGDPDPYSFFHSSEVKDPGHNFSGYFTFTMDRSLEAARRTTDQAKRRELYTSVFQSLATEVPVVFLYFSDYLYAQNRQVQGLRIAPISDPRERFWNAEDWYVRTARR